MINITLKKREPRYFVALIDKNLNPHYVREISEEESRLYGKEWEFIPISRIAFFGSLHSPDRLDRDLITHAKPNDYVLYTRGITPHKFVRRMRDELKRMRGDSLFS